MYTKNQSQLYCSSYLFSKKATFHYMLKVIYKIEISGVNHLLHVHSIKHVYSFIIFNSFGTDRFKTEVKSNLIECQHIVNGLSTLLVHCMSLIWLRRRQCVAVVPSAQTLQT